MVESTNNTTQYQEYESFLQWYLKEALRQRKGEIGFYFEDFVRHFIYQQPLENLGKNDTNTHDIDLTDNLFCEETVSIKATGTTTIGCGDAKGFFGYDFEKKHSMIVFRYEKLQTKLRVSAYKFEYTKELHTKLFGNITYEQIERLRQLIKEVPNEIGTEFERTKNLVIEYRNSIIGDAMISLDYKIDDTVKKSPNRRLQCSFTFNKLRKLGVKLTQTNTLDIGADQTFMFPKEIPYDERIGNNGKAKPNQPIEPLTSRPSQPLVQSSRAKRSKTIVRKPTTQNSDSILSQQDLLLKKHFKPIKEGQKSKKCSCGKVIQQQTREKLLKHIATHAQ